MQINNTRCKKPVTIVSGRVSQHRYDVIIWNFAALVLTYFQLTKGRATFFRPKTVVSFLHILVLICKMFINQLDCLTILLQMDKQTISDLRNSLAFTQQEKKGKGF